MAIYLNLFIEVRVLGIVLFSDGSIKYIQIILNCSFKLIMTKNFNGVYNLGDSFVTFHQHFYLQITDRKAI